MQNFPYVITISSEKGGVGKTTLATNLAIFLKALNEDLPVSIFSFDNHFTVDKMFEIKGQPVRGSVIDLLLETPGHELLHTGQYGVNYIPSSTMLNDLKQSIKSSMVLARLMSVSNIPGVVIIDTRPDLDILTQNALYAADRVIIPVKDMASLENCRNIFDLFDKKGLDKKSLSLIPCLIDSRIKYDGIFRDQRTLLKSYAINRGYRCLDTYISKSPKVESLSTNPSGRIFPILTYARGTDVYGQFHRLATMLLDEMKQTREARSYLFHQWYSAEDARKKEAFYARMTGVKGECLLCRKPLLQDGSGTAAYYYETSDGAMCGFIEEDCYFDFLLSSVYNLQQTIPADHPTFGIFKDAAKESVYLFRPVQAEGTEKVQFILFDRKGQPQMQKMYPLQQYEGGFLSRNKTRLYTFIWQTLEGYGGQLRDGFVLVHPVDPREPEAILRDENYREFNRLRLHLEKHLGGTSRESAPATPPEVPAEGYLTSSEA